MLQLCLFSLTQRTLFICQSILRFHCHPTVIIYRYWILTLIAGIHQLTPTVLFQCDLVHQIASCRNPVPIPRWKNIELLEKEVCSVEVHVSSFVTELSSLIRPYVVVIQSFRFTSWIRRIILRHLKLINTHSQVSLTLQMFHGPSLFFWYK